MKRSNEQRFNMKSSILCSSNIIVGVLVFASVVCAQKTEGIPGVDYPNYHSIPKTSFKCSEQKYIPGFYADLETECQVFHFCFKGGEESFLCPTGTTFNQVILTCDSWDNSNCTLSPLSFSVNAGPAMERAGKRIPMLMKLRNRSQGKSKTPTVNIFEKLSTLYEANTDSVSQGLEVSKDVSSSSNVTSKSSEESSKDNIESETEPSLSNHLSGLEDNSQDVGENDDSRFESRVHERIVYDPVKKIHYAEYNPYEMQSEPSEEFTGFYQVFGNEYGGDNEDYSEYGGENHQDYDNSVYDVEEPERVDFNTVEELTDDELEFSKRSWSDRQSKPFRKRPVYIIVKDDEESTTRSPELVTVNEASMVLQRDEAAEESEIDETSEENTGGPEVSEEVLRRLQFPPERVLPTVEPLTSQEFEHLILSEIAFPGEFGVQRDEGKSFQSEGEQMYETDLKDDLASAENNFQPGSYSDLEPTDESQELDPRFYDLSSGSNDAFEVSQDPDDVLIVIPEESDSNIVDETGSRSEQNAFEEMLTNEQMDAESQEGEEFDQYGYYNSYRGLPERFEADSPYGADESENLPADYYNYIPEADRIAYLNYLRNLQGVDADGESYPEQLDQQMSFIDPETGYLYYGNPYSENEEFSYYGTDEASQYYSKADSSWDQQGSPEDSQNELGVTDVPLPLDITESHLIGDMTGSDSDEVSTAAELERVEDFQDLSFDNSNERTVYVFDFDEDGEEQIDDSKVNDTDSQSSVFEAHSELNEVLKKQNVSLEDSESSKLNTPKNNMGTSSLDSFFASQNKNLKSSVPSKSLAFNKKSSSNSWSNLATESSQIEDKPVTLSSTLEHLASMKTVKPSTSNFNNMDFSSSDTRFFNSMAFPESMDFGPYGYGANMAQHYGMNPIQSSNFDQFAHRTGESDKQRASKLSSIGDRIRSMKQGKFGVFKKLIKQ